jgi:hypothetical protein
MRDYEFSNEGLWSINIWDSFYSKIRDLLIAKSLKDIILLWINCLDAL